MKTLVIGLVLFAGIAQAQDVHVTVGKSYVIPYVVGSPGTYGIGVQVNATHPKSLVLGVATNVVVPSNSLEGTYGASVDHYVGNGTYQFVAIVWGIPADAGVLPIRVLARQVGEYDLEVRTCTLSMEAKKYPTMVRPVCENTTTHIFAEESPVALRAR